jgi:hypothetical protein
MKCQCPSVVIRLVRCQFMADGQECVMCRVCDVHFHMPKGSRATTKEAPMPFVPDTVRAKGANR